MGKLCSYVASYVCIAYCVGNTRTVGGIPQKKTSRGGGGGRFFTLPLAIHSRQKWKKGFTTTIWKLHKIPEWPFAFFNLMAFSSQCKHGASWSLYSANDAWYRLNQSFSLWFHKRQQTCIDQTFMLILKNLLCFIDILFIFNSKAEMRKCSCY